MDARPPHSLETSRADIDRLRNLLHPKYELLRLLGFGAFGDVFEARQTSTGQSVAIKVLHATDNDSARRRFRLEMRSCAALNHPHIVRVLDAGGGDAALGPLYTVFEYVPGQTLAERLTRDGMLPVQAALDLMTQVLDALASAHQLGIVHRDLKPANIMVTETTSGLHAKVLDFGISAFIQSHRDAGSARVTQSGERVGTPAYCAPEQLRGEPTSVLVDYYAWGLVLLECLSGEHTFSKRSIHDVLHAQFSPEPVPIPSLLTKHPLGDLLRWSLEKDPARRAANAQQLLARLRRLDVRALTDDAGFLRISPAAERGTSSLGPTEVAPLARAASERRPLTALCCRIVLEQALLADEEEAFDEWLDDLRETIEQIARRNGGRLVNSAGAELLVYFGLDMQVSGEASPRRAARAALEIRDYCARRSNLMRARAGWNIDMHFGLHQGMVTVHTAANPTFASLSSTAMTAARLCQLAAPGEIATSQAAVGLLLGLRRFEAQPEDAALGSQPWYRLSSDAPDAEFATATDGDAIGRSEELERLANVMAIDGTFSARCVVLAGPAGIGKTHVSLAWHRQLAARGCRLLSTRCLPETQGSALYPILQLVRDQLRLDPRDPEQALAALAGFLTACGHDLPSHMPVLCAWLGLAQTAWPEPALSPKKKRDQLLALMTKLVGQLCPAPNLLFIEDIHWADPTTLEWLQLMASGDLEPRPLLSCTLRTGAAGLAAELSGNAFDPALLALLADARTLCVPLAPLTEASARQLLARACGAEFDATPFVKRGAGIPFFLLELARCGVAARDIVLPPSIAELLRFRIDQLGHAKETAQLAAVIGPQFDHELLHSLSLRGDELLGDLVHLQNAGIIAAAGDKGYAFAHSLLHDSAYQSLPRKDRQRLHRGVAARLTVHQPELETTQPWLLALHHHYGGQTDHALVYGEAAATQALVRFDNLEALGYVRQLKGNEPQAPSGWLREIDLDHERARIELRLLALEATALMLTRGWSDQELNRSCQRANQLFPQVPNAETLQMRYVLAQFYFSSGWRAAEAGGDDQRARPWIDALIAAAAESGVPALCSLGSMMLAAWCLFQGKIAESIAAARRVERCDDAQAAWKYGYDALLCARSIESQARWLQGDALALDFTLETLKLAEAFGHPASLANVQLYSLTQLQLEGRRAETSRRCDELLELCERTGLQGFPAYAVIFKGWAIGDPSLARGAFEALTGAGQRLCEAFCCTIVAEAEFDAGHKAVALDRLDDAEARVAQTGERFVLPQILRLQARCLHAQEPERAESLLQRAIEIATQQSAFGMRACLLEERTKFQLARQTRSHVQPLS